MGLVNNLPGMAYRCRNEPSWTMLFVSAGCRELTGYAPQDLVENRTVAFADLIFPEDRQHVWEEVQEAVRADRIFELSYRIESRDGDIKWVSERGAGIRGDDGEIGHLEGFIIDITERKVMESQLRQSEKMQTLGYLAGAVAHDFNNLLTAIGGYASLLRQRLGEEPEELERILAATDSATALTGQLLGFSRAEPVQRRELDLNAEVSRAFHLIRRLIPESVTLELSLAREPLPVTIDPSQVQQILMNLVINASDALPKGGRVSVATMARSGDGPAGDPRAILTVDDDGEGVPDALRSRIFDPFFTTKEGGEGTGLGLSTVRRIVEDELGGAIGVSSRAGEGSHFEIALPLTSAPQGAEEPRTPTAVARDSAGRPTILVADDDRMILDLLRTVLDTHGYRVLHAQDAGEAIRIMDGASVEIDLLVTDTIMPEEDGSRLASRFLSRFGDADVLYISGYLPADLSPAAYEAMKGGHFLQKPFEPETFLAKVEELLGTG